MRKTISSLLLALTCIASVAHAQEAPPTVVVTPPPPIGTAPPPATVPPPVVVPPPGVAPGQPYYYPPPAYMRPGPPPPTRFEMKPNYALIFTGVGLVGLGYIMDVSGTLLVGHDPAWESAIPIVGPYLQVNDTFSHDWGDLGRAFYVFDGLTETAGLVLTIVGAALWHKVPVRMAQNGLVVAF
ncbi:MAG TPA: hypothetical protein VN947_27800 [Polyangia bacterium]|nr:hypothetical protein [Polyangia bacterium]